MEALQIRPPGWRLETKESPMVFEGKHMKKKDSVSFCMVGLCWASCWAIAAIILIGA